jgi:hypothetical protein
VRELHSKVIVASATAGGKRGLPRGVEPQLPLTSAYAEARALGVACQGPGAYSSSTKVVSICARWSFPE